MSVSLVSKLNWTAIELLTKVDINTLYEMEKDEVESCGGDQFNVTDSPLTLEDRNCGSPVFEKMNNYYGIIFISRLY